MSFGSNSGSSSTIAKEEPFKKGGDQTPLPKQRNNRPADSFNLGQSASLLPDDGDSVSTLGRTQSRQQSRLLR